MVPVDFDAIYDAAMESRAAIGAAIREMGLKTYSEEKWCLLEVGDTVNYRTHISPVDPKVNSISVLAAPLGRNCTVQQIKEATAKTIAALVSLTRQGRIAQLEEELAKLKAEEE